MSDPRPSEHQDDRLELPEMRRRGFFDDVPTLGKVFFAEPEPDLSETDDHKAEALGLLGAEWRNGAAAVAQVAEAQVHATLYLAEQQRIANMIAWQLGTAENYEREIPEGAGPMIGRDADLAAAGDDLRDLVETSLVIDDCPHPFTPRPEDLA